MFVPLKGVALWFLAELSYVVCSICRCGLISKAEKLHNWIP